MGARARTQEGEPVGGEHLAMSEKKGFSAVVHTDGFHLLDRRSTFLFIILVKI